MPSQDCIHFAGFIVKNSSRKIGFLSSEKLRVLLRNAPKSNWFLKEAFVSLNNTYVAMLYHEESICLLYLCYKTFQSNLLHGSTHLPSDRENTDKTWHSYSRSERRPAPCHRLSSKGSNSVIIYTRETPLAEMNCETAAWTHSYLQNCHYMHYMRTKELKDTDFPNSYY